MTEKDIRLEDSQIKCKRCDFNARTPTRIGSEPIAFGLAGQLSHVDLFTLDNI